METSENSPEPNLNPLTSSLQDTPANLSAKLARELEQQTRGIFGPKPHSSFAYFDPVTSCWKTSQATFLSDLEQFSEIWPDAGMMRNGVVYELRTSGPVTSESGSSLWPTTRSSSGGGNKSAYEGAPYRPALAQISQIWNTPSTEDHKTDGPAALGRYQNGKPMSCDLRLRNQAALWPTARQEDGESCGNHPGAVDSLTGATKLWPTPAVPNGGRTSNTSNYREDGSKQQVDLGAMAPLWKTPHGMGNEDFRGKKGGAGGGEFAKQANNWGTPNSNERTHTPRGTALKVCGRDRVASGIQLANQAEMFPTWASRDYRTPNLKPGAEWGMGTKGEQLQNFVEHYLPSPLAPQIPDGLTSSESVQTSRLHFARSTNGFISLDALIYAKWAWTATQRNSATGFQRKSRKRRLNPKFVCWLMGLPVGWTEL